jgi:hypothetical protein
VFGNNNFRRFENTKEKSIYQPPGQRAEEVIFFEKRVLFEWFKDR